MIIERKGHILYRIFKRNKIEDAEKRVDQFLKAFNDDFVLEVQRTNRLDENEYFDISVGGSNGNLGFNFATSGGDATNTGTTVTNDGQCMGRVYDQRRSGTKYIKNGCKFPLGFWKKGETRSFSVTDSGRSRTVELKILSLGKKPTSCVKYNWKMFDASNGKKLADNDYKFCNKKVMTSLLIRKIKD